MTQENKQRGLAQALIFYNRRYQIEIRRLPLKYRKAKQNEYKHSVNSSKHPVMDTEKRNYKKLSQMLFWFLDRTKDHPCHIKDADNDILEPIKEYYRENRPSQKQNPVKRKQVYRDKKKHRRAGKIKCPNIIMGF